VNAVQAMELFPGECQVNDRWIGGFRESKKFLPHWLWKTVYTSRGSLQTTAAWLQHL
jgi:hypothetical protein